MTDSNPLSALDLAKLLLLAAIWGGAFILMRLVVPELGALLTASLRIIVAGLALLLFAYLRQIPLQWRANIKVYALSGLLGALLPFALFCYASSYLPAAFSALFNAACPLFVALFSLLWLNESLNLRTLAGLLLGAFGVLVLVGSCVLLHSRLTLLAALACIAAPACFALSGIIIKRYSCANNLQRAHKIIEPLPLAVGSMVAAALMCLPILPFLLPAQLPSPLSILLLLTLALLPSALAQIIFIPLLAKIGPTRAMSVSFLIPLFSLVGGVLFLQESLPLSSLGGGLMVLTATALILKR
ncbi:MAG TPA: DMT family transporter [Cellvibrio sp.]|nr:DMT family transporter [Cellvibrio sp.]